MTSSKLLRRFHVAYCLNHQVLMSTMVAQSGYPSKSKLEETLPRINCSTGPVTILSITELTEQDYKDFVS